MLIFKYLLEIMQDLGACNCAITGQWSSIMAKTLIDKVIFVQKCQLSFAFVCMGALMV